MPHKDLNSSLTAPEKVMVLKNGSVIKTDLYSYDKYGNVIREEIQTSEEDYIISEYTYDKQSHFPEKNVVRNIKNADGESDSISTAFSYDEYGNLISTKDSAGNKVTYKYDFLNRKILEKLEDGSEREYLYSDEDNTILTTDAAGRRLLYSYDPYGRLLKVTDVIGKYNLAEKEYDVKGRLILERDVNGAVWYNEIVGDVPVSSRFVRRSENGMDVRFMRTCKNRHVPNYACS